MILALLFLGFFGIPLALGAVWKLRDRATPATVQACGWNEERAAYTAAITVSNRDPAYRAATFQVQFRLKPPSGERWPDPSVRTRYEAISTTVDVLLKPKQEDTVFEAALPIPVPRYQCTADTWPVRGRRFDQEPDATTLAASGYQPGTSIDYRTRAQAEGF
jgi:hypothetical protein